MTTAPSELEELRTSLRKALRTPAPGVAPSLDPHWRTSWPTLAALGLASLCIAEESGGFGLHVPAAAMAATELGGVLHAGPFAACTAAGLVLDRAIGAESKAAVVKSVASGAAVATLAVLDRGTISVDGDRVNIDGTASLLVAGDTVDWFVVVSPDLCSLALARRDDCQLAASAHTFDVTRSFVDARFDATPAAAISCDVAVVRLALVVRDLLVAADALGGVQRSLERTVRYAGERVAFGRAIGGFQAVQHRLVDHTLRVRSLSLLVDAAAADLGATGDEHRALLAQAAVARHAVHVLHDLLQLTGGIGFTWEHGLHLYERRAHLDARLTRNPRRALLALADAEGWVVRS